MSKKTRIKNESPDLRIPQSRDEATEYIAEIGRLQRKRQRIEADMNDALAEVRQRFEAQALPLAGDIKQLTAGLQTWCEANRSSLTQGGKVKFAQLASGEIKWRMRPPKVTLKGTDAIIEACKKLKLERFLREKVEVNKEALLAEPDVAKTLNGVSISQGEDFIVTPFETELEEVA